MVRMNFGHLLLELHNSYIHLYNFLAHFLSYFNDSMTYDVINDDMSYWAHGPCAHQVSLRYLEKWARYHHCLTTSIIIIIAKMKPHKNKIPFPYRGNGITRGTVPRGTVDPIPNGLSLWPRTMFRQVTPSHDHCSAPPLYRHVWDYCQTGIIARVAW